MNNVLRAQAQCVENECAPSLADSESVQLSGSLKVCAVDFRADIEVCPAAVPAR